MKRHFIFFFLCWSWAFFVPQALYSQADTLKPPCELVILHTNDLRGRLTPGAYYDEGDRGGLARVVRLLQSSQANNVITLDGGNPLGPGLLAQFDQGSLMVDLMNSAGYDAMTLGNQDLAYGLDVLQSRAAQARFSFLAANIVRQGGGGEPLWQSHRLLERAEMRVLTIGLVSPRLGKLVNPLKISGIEITDPAAALRHTLEQTRNLAADLVIALVHMSAAEAEALARAFPQVDLFIAGGFDAAPEKDGNLHVMRTANGNRVVSTPGGGAYIGRIRLCFDSGAFDAALVPIGPHLPAADDITRRIQDHQRRYRQTRANVLTTLPAAIDSSHLFVARLMRQALDTEVALINRGALRGIVLKDTLRLSQLDRLVRFDDDLFRLKLKGSELKGLAAASKTRTKAGQRLVFAGYTPAEDQVNGRPLDANETYSVATTGYLAHGGDAYLQGHSPQAAAPPKLQETLTAFFSRPRPDLAALDRTGGVWKLRAKLNNTLAWTNRNRHADRYTGNLGGRDALAWSSLVDARAVRADARGSLSADLKTNFGQVRSDGRLQEAADRIDADLVYTLRAGKTPPFAGINTKTVWTVPSGADRPLVLRATAGIERNLSTHLKSRWGLALERDFAARANRFGLEAVPEYRLKFPGGNEFKSNSKLFFGFTTPRNSAIQSYNTLLLHLWGNLHATVDANLFFQWDDKIDATGLKSELQVGLGYAWDRKVAP